jgi:hypothetical protein
MMSVATQVVVDRVRSAEEVDPAAWDRLAASSALYLSHTWVRGVADALAMSSEYLLATIDGRLVGVLPVHWGGTHPNPRYRPGVAFGDLEPGWNGRFTLAGAATGYHTDLLVDRDLPAPQRFEVVAALLAGVREAVRREGTRGAFFMYCTEQTTGELTAHAPDAVLLRQFPEAEIPLPGSGPGDYLASLPGPRRRRVRAEMRAFATAGYTPGRERLPDIWHEAVPLVAAVEAKYGGRLSSEQVAEVLRVQAQQFGELGVAFTARRGGRLVGLCVCYPWAGRLYARLVGFDYPALAGAFEYFALTYYQPIEYCYEQRLTALNLGPGAYRAKTLRGARLSPRWAVVIDATAVPDRATLARWNEEAAAGW